MNYTELRFGIEIETVFQTRAVVAQAIQSVTGGTIWQSSTEYGVTQPDGRKWKVVHDGSLSSAPANKRAEVVSPILTYDDIPVLQQIVRAVKRCGAKVNHECGIHVHIDAAPFSGEQIANLAKMVYKQEPLIQNALGISVSRLSHYAKPTSPDFIAKLNASKPKTKEALNVLWYGQATTNPIHYHNSRYHGVNLHNIWYRGTIEFRWFNGTLHAGKVKTYIQLCLAIGAKAHAARSASSAGQRTFNPASAKYDMRVFLLRLGMIGDEFKTARKFLLEDMPGSAAWKNGSQQAQTTTNANANAA